MRNNSRKWWWIILLAAGGLYSIGIWWGLPDYDGWAPDELTPLRVITGLKQGFANGWYDTYPPLHYYVLSFVYSPMLLLHMLGTIDIMSLPAYTVLFYISRLVSVVMAMGVIYWMHRVGRELAGNIAGYFAALTTALLMPLNYYAKVANVDVPYLFWFTGSLYFYVRILKYFRSVDYMWFAVLATAAICTKDQACGLYILPVIYAIYRNCMYLKQDKGIDSLKAQLVHPPLLKAVIFAIVLFLMIHNVFFNWDGIIGHFRFITGPGSDFAEFPPTFRGHIAMAMKTLAHLVFSFGWPAFLLSGTGIGMAVLCATKRRELAYLALFPISYYIFFVSVVRYNYVRFLLPICFVIILMASLGIANMWRRWYHFPLLRWLPVMVVGLYSIWYTCNVNCLLLNDSRYEAEKWLAENIPLEARVAITPKRMYGPRRQGIIELVPKEVGIQRVAPDYLIVNIDEFYRFDENSPEQRFYWRLKNGKTVYSKIQHFKNNISANRLKNKSMLTNLLHLNPELDIYKKRESILSQDVH